MDIVSYGVASQAASGSRKTDKEILGVGVKDTHANVKERLDNLDDDINGAHALADKMIVQDAVNIMKAHAKLNAVAKATKYEMHNMIFDDLLDLSGIDTAKSSGYTHDAVNGSILNGIIETTTIETIASPSKLILTIDTKSAILGVNVANDSKKASASSAPDDRYLPKSAFDGINGNAYNYWFSKTASNEWIKYDFDKSPKIIGTYTIAPRNSTGAPKSWTFEGSNDNISWDILDTQINQINWMPYEERDYSFSNNKSYRYYRFFFTSNNGASTINVTEIKMTETTYVDLLVPCFISRDGGAIWNSITPDALFYFSDSISPLEKNIRIKMELPSGIKLLNYALTWA